MTISIDTNVIAALWADDHVLNDAAVRLLKVAGAPERLVISGVVYSELMTGPLRDEEALDAFFADTGIAVDWAMDEDVWREAGRAYRRYVRRRKTSGGGNARRMLADFLIGAHALVRGHALLTFNGDDFATAFTGLQLIVP
jgi:predicted nucleic acid-binding protein